jgi:hypothetical protein
MFMMTFTLLSSCSLVRDDRCAVERQRCVVDEDVAVLLELRMECDRPQALLDKAGLHVRAERIEVGEIDERLRQDLVVLGHHAHPPDALDNEDAARVVVRGRDADGITEAVGNFDERKLRRARDCSARLGDLGRRGRNLLRVACGNAQTCRRQEDSECYPFHDGSPGRFLGRRGFQFV